MTVVLKNVSDRPIRVKLTLGLGFEFKVEAKVRSPGRKVRWSHSAGTGAGYEGTLPPGGILAPEFPIGDVYFTPPTFKSGDQVTMTVTHANQEGGKKVWKGRLQAPPVVLVRR
jgi:hypothetical protein